VGTWIRVALLLGAMTMVLGACGLGSPEPAPSSVPATSTTSSAPPSSSPSAGAGAATAMDAYRGMWKAYIDAGRIPDPQYPDLTRYAQGDALTVFVKGLTSMQKDGLVGQGDVVLNPKVTTIRPNATPPTVDIEDCVDTSKSHLVKKDGSPYQDTPGGNRSAKATVAQVGEGVWKVTSLAVFGVGTC
jgi:hypothetical protein